jgi:hypothetical protein
MSNCGCGHCDCNDDSKEKQPEEKVEDLKKALEELGYDVKENDNGEIIVGE